MCPSSCLSSSGLRVPFERREPSKTSRRRGRRRRPPARRPAGCLLVRALPELVAEGSELVRRLPDFAYADVVVGAEGDVKLAAVWGPVACFRKFVPDRVVLLLGHARGWKANEDAHLEPFPGWIGGPAEPNPWRGALLDDARRAPRGGAGTRARRAPTIRRSRLRQWRARGLSHIERRRPLLKRKTGPAGIPCASESVASARWSRFSCLCSLGAGVDGRRASPTRLLRFGRQNEGVSPSRLAGTLVPGQGHRPYPVRTGGRVADVAARRIQTLLGRLTARPQGERR